MQVWNEECKRIDNSQAVNVFRYEVLKGMIVVPGRCTILSIATAIRIFCETYMGRMGTQKNGEYP